MTKIYQFERLARFAVEKEIKNNLDLVKNVNLGITFFKTEHVSREYKRTVTVWFEVKSRMLKFWDLKPVIIIYEGHNLYLEDIRSRTAQYFTDTANNINKKIYDRYYKSYDN